MSARLRTVAADDVVALLPRLTRLLVDVVADGASIGFHPPLADGDAERYWRGVEEGLRRGERVLVAAFDPEGELVGAAQLALEPRPNGRHRAEVQKVIVDPSARRRGVARALMDALDEAAQAAGRTFLFLDTREGDAAEELYRSLGWELAGRVPGYVLEHDGTTSATLIFYRTLPATRPPSPGEAALRLRVPDRHEELGPPALKVVGFELWVHGRSSPGATESWDADWLDVTAYCAAPGARVWVAGPILGSSSLARWAEACAALGTTLRGKAELHSFEPNLRALIEAEDWNGHMVFAVFITPDHTTQEHRFEFPIDQSYLPRLLTDLRAILVEYPVPPGLNGS